jgi:hypothetical protein
MVEAVVDDEIVFLDSAGRFCELVRRRGPVAQEHP